MTEPTTAHSNASAAEAAAPIITTTTTTTVTSSKKTSVEDERDIDAPNVSYKKTTVTAAGKEAKKMDGGAGGKGSEKDGEGGDSTEVKVNKEEASGKDAGGGGEEEAVTSVKEASEGSQPDAAMPPSFTAASKTAEPLSGKCSVGEIKSGGDSVNKDEGSKAAELSNVTSTIPNKDSDSAVEVGADNATSAKMESAEPAGSGNSMDADKTSKRDELNKSAQSSDTKPLNVNEPSKRAEPSKTTPPSGEGSTAGTSKPAASASQEPGADEKVGEHGLSPRDAVHSNNVRNADEVIKSWGPVLQVRNLFPGMGPSFFMMEKSVFDHPLRQVVSALDYYEELRKRATLTQNQQRLVAIAEHTRDELRRLQRVRDGSVGVDVVDL